MTQNIKSCVLIGSDSLLIECGDAWRARGHSIAAVVTDAPRVASWARAEKLVVIDANGDYGAALAAYSFDYLFAITFLRVIPAPVLGLPKQAAINFHDGPLPRYAGLNAPSWALIKRAKEYGITWHVMSMQVDRGDILKQVPVEISAEDTSLSLNTRCFAAAIESFAELADELAAGTEQRTPQLEPPAGEDVYFGRYARPAAAALIDWQAPAEASAALVRALSFGPRYPNTLGAASILLGERAYLVTEAEASLARTDAAPGTLVAAGFDTLSIACGEGTLLVRGLREPSGVEIPMSVALSRLGIELGARFTQLSEPERDALSALDHDLAKSEAFWVRRLATIDPPELPYDSGAQRPSASEYRELPLQLSETFSATFPGELALAAAFASYIGRLAGKPQVALAFCDAQLTAAAGGFEALVATTVPLLLQSEPATSFAELVARLSAEIDDAHRRKGFLRNLGARHPTLSGAAVQKDAALLPVGIARGVDRPAGALLQLRLDAGGARLRCSAARLSAADAAGLVSGLHTFMENLAAAPHCAVEQIELLSTAARERQLVTWNRTERAVPERACIHTLIEAQVDRTPDAIAVSCNDRSLTYRQLDDAANRVAARLLALGVTRDTAVGVHVERSLELVVAALGVMKAGAAYLPLDPTYPADRIALMLDDAKVTVVVTTAALVPGLAGRGVRALALDTEADLLAQLPATRPNLPVEPNRLAYLIYTSGSTGKPKGVMIEHRQAVNFFVGMDERVEHATPGVWLAVTSLSFDISVLELWWTLARGFHVVVHVDQARSAARAIGHDDAHAHAVHDARPVQFSLFYFSADAQATGGARYRLLLEGAKFADEHEFSAVWTPERHFHAFGGLYPNPAVTGAAVAAITKRVGIRAGSVVLPLHHPVRVVEQWSVVDNISDGRVGISIASGWQPNDFVLMPDNYANAKSIMMRDLEVVRRLWRGETVEFPGPLGKPVAVRTQPEPVQKELPVWITTAGNEETFEIAGRAGANVLTHLLGQSLDKLAPKIAAYRRARAAAGFDPETGIVSLMLHTFVGPDRERVKELVRAPLTSYLATSMDLIKDKAWTFPAFKRPKNFRADAPGNDLATLSDEDRAALLDAAFERYFETSGLFGTVDDAARMVRAVKAIGVDDVACLIDFGAATDVVLEHLPYVDAVRQRELADRAAATLPAPSVERELGETHPLLHEVQKHGVTHLQCTPSMARMFLGHEDTRAALGQLAHLFLGGEGLPADLLRELRAQTRATITNMYGPTETTVWSTTHRIGADETSAAIGTPIANTTVYVTDEQRRLLPVGVPGELWIGGHGVARGYWQRPELDAERFVRDPFSTDAGARMYRTGDRARWRADGVLECLGRSDFQVKLRGYRIEPGEIEALARTAPNVAECAVVLREDRPGDQRLVAYLVAAPGTSVAVATVRELLRRELPEHMVPAALVVIAALPLTANQKLDRKALPAPETLTSPAADGGSTAELAAPPESDGERVIAGVWRELLGRERVGIDDNFFDLGGHSLLVVRMHRMLQDALRRSLALTDLYRFPTIRTFASFLASGASGDSKKATARGAKRRELLQRRGG